MTYAKPNKRLHISGEGNQLTGYSMSRDFSNDARILLLAASLLAALLLLSTMLANANVPGGGSQGPDVALKQNGDDVILDNGTIQATIDTTSARILVLKYKGRDMIDEEGKHGSIYFSRDGGATYENLGHCVYSVTKQTPDTVDISCDHIYSPDKKDKAPWDVDAHFVLRRGASGLYVYTVNSHPASYPDLTVGEWRMVWPTPNIGEDHLLENVYIDDLRHWTMPTAGDYNRAVGVPGAPKEVMRITTGGWAGKLDSKYVYSAKYWDLGCWGYASDKNHLGAWYVFGSHEFFSNGPTKQDLTATMGLNLVHLNMNHLGGTEIHVKEGAAWQKVYGPYLLYFNDKASGYACWMDAKAQAQAEAAAWPYSWLNNPAYPSAKERGTAQGRLIVKDALKPEVSANNAWIGLALPETSAEGPWQNQAAGYQYWVRVAPDGSFTIPSVRPGNYTLYAFTEGAVGEFAKKDVTITPGTTTVLGDLTWQVPHKGMKIAWEIGVPDRSAAEFKHGNEFFYPLVYQQVPRDFPNPLDYHVDKSKWATDWNYAQSSFWDGSKYVPQQWRIHFRLAQVPSGDATLTIAIASSHRAHIAVYVNDMILLSRRSIRVTKAETRSSASPNMPSMTSSLYPFPRQSCERARMSSASRKLRSLATASPTSCMTTWISS